MTINNELDIEKLDYTQERINALIAEEDIIKSRKILKFLVESDLIGDRNNKKELLESLDQNLINENESVKKFVEGVRDFNIAINSTDVDTIQKRYTESIDAFSKALELNPSNYEARTFLAASYFNLGNKLGLNVLLEKALDEYNAALVIDSTLSYVYLDIATTLESLNRISEICPYTEIAAKLGRLDSLRNADLQYLMREYCRDRILPTSSQNDKDES